MLENSTQGLTLLDAAHTVVVTGVEHHQPALAAWAPFGDGRPRQVAVELRLTHGPGQRGMEVLLDGRRVGELPQAMAERYAPYVDDLTAHGGRPAAVGVVARDPRGLEMELRLPDLTGPAEATTALSLVAPAWPQPGPEPRNHRPYLIGAGVLALLLVVGMVVGGRSGGDDTVAVARPTTAPRTIAPEITLPVPTATAEPTAEVREAADPAPTRTPRTRAQAPSTTAPPPPPSAPAPETTSSAPTETATTTATRRPLFPNDGEPCVENAAEDTTCPPGDR